MKTVFVIAGNRGEFDSFAQEKIREAGGKLDVKAYRERAEVRIGEVRYVYPWLREHVMGVRDIAGVVHVGSWRSRHGASEMYREILLRMRMQS